MSNRYHIKPLLLIALILLCLFGACKNEEPEAVKEPVTVALDPNFKLLEYGLSALEDTYHFQFSHIYEMTIGLTHEALYNKDVDVGLGFTTDGKIKELDLVKLQDDKKAFPANNPALVVRREVLEEHPTLQETLKEIISCLDAETMITLNYLIHIKEEDPYEIAYHWLQENSFLKDDPPAQVQGDPVIIGSTLMTEQQILKNLTFIALTHQGIPMEEKTYLLETRGYPPDLLEGHIHMYWAYLAHSMHYLLGEEGITHPQKSLERLAQRDKPHDLIWLLYAPFNSYYTLIMRKDKAQELGIETISHLAQWIKEVQGE